MDKRLDFSQMASALAQQDNSADLPLDYPLDQWQPKDCGELPLEIDAQGRWWSLDQQQRSPYQRPELVKLFSALLWCDQPDFSPAIPGTIAPVYSLRTPHESLRIKVIDSPFMIVDYAWATPANTASVMQCFTNLGAKITLGKNHPLVLGCNPPYAPYVLVKRNLWAKFNRNIYYRLINELLTAQPDSEKLSFSSEGIVFIISPTV